MVQQDKSEEVLLAEYILLFEEVLVWYLYISMTLSLSICRPYGPLTFEWMNWWMGGGSSRWRWTPSVLLHDSLTFPLNLPEAYVFLRRAISMCITVPAVQSSKWLCLLAARAKWLSYWRTTLCPQTADSAPISQYLERHGRYRWAFGYFSADTNTQSHNSHCECHSGIGSSHLSQSRWLCRKIV